MFIKRDTRLVITAMTTVVSTATGANKQLHRITYIIINFRHFQCMMV